jgi:hypothetical protein
MNARLPLIAALDVGLLPWKASAQTWVNNRDLDGIGVRTGNLELHWSAGAEFGYDSNYYRSSGEGVGEDIVDVLKLRLTPAISISTLGAARRNSPTPPTVAFKAGAQVGYEEVFALDSDQSDVSQRRNANVGADARLDLFPKGKIGFDLLAAFVRTIDTDGTSEDLAGEGFNRDTLRGGAGLTWRPGGGLFEWRAGYGITYNFLEDADFDYLRNVQHGINTRGRWKFLPRSALLFDGNYTMVRYTDPNSPQNDGDSMAARVGFHGLVTYHLSLLGMLGWATSFYESSPTTIEARQYDGLIANAEARWFIMPRPNLDEATVATGLSSVALGYARTFNNSYQGSYYQRDRGYIRGDLFLLGAVTGGLEVGLSRIGHPEAVGAPGAPDSPAITEMRIDGGAFAEYRLTDIFALNTTFSYDRSTNDPGVEVTGENLDYSRWQWYVGARFFM